MPEKQIDPIPETFSSLTEAGEFTAVENVITGLRNRYREVETQMSIAQALRDEPRQRGVPVRDLAAEMLG
jgi:hypothetical protein